MEKYFNLVSFAIAVIFGSSLGWVFILSVFVFIVLVKIINDRLEPKKEVLPGIESLVIKLKIKNGFIFYFKHAFSLCLGYILSLSLNWIFLNFVV